MDSLITSFKALSHAEQDRIIMAVLQSRYSSAEAPKKGRKPKAVEPVVESETEAPKPAKKGRKPKAAESSESESSGSKPKAERSEAQKAWPAFVGKVRDFIRTNTSETNFAYKYAMSVASLLKKEGHMEATDEQIHEAYNNYRLEHPASDSESSSFWSAFVNSLQVSIRKNTDEKNFTHKDALGLASLMKKNGLVHEDDLDEDLTIDEIMSSYKAYRLSVTTTSALAPAPTAHVTTTPERPAAVKKVAAPKKAKAAPFKGLWEFEGVTYERDDSAIFSVSGEWVGRYDAKKNIIDRLAPAPELSYD
jgi:hypothetical protein